jgi:hypothetical protein
MIINTGMADRGLPSIYWIKSTLGPDENIMGVVYIISKGMHKNTMEKLYIYIYKETKRDYQLNDRNTVVQNTSMLLVMSNVWFSLCPRLACSLLHRVLSPQKESQYLFNVAHIPCKRLTLQYLIQLTARATINICCFVMLFLHVSAGRVHLQGGRLRRNTFIINITNVI